MLVLVHLKLFRDEELCMDNMAQKNDDEIDDNSISTRSNNCHNDQQLLL